MPPRLIVAARWVSAMVFATHLGGVRALYLVREYIGECDATKPYATAQQHPKPPAGEDDKLLHIASCPDTSTCPTSGSTRTVFVYEGGKTDAAFGNHFYSMSANAVLYANHKGFAPWIQFNRSRTYKTMGKNVSALPDPRAARKLSCCRACSGRMQTAGCGKSSSNPFAPTCRPGWRPVETWSRRRSSR